MDKADITYHGISNKAHLLRSKHKTVLFDVPIRISILIMIGQSDVSNNNTTPPAIVLKSLRLCCYFCSTCF